MEQISLNVRELTSDERGALERAVGHALSENQRVILQVVTLDAESPTNEAAKPDGGLPTWTNVYEGLSDAEIADLEEVILERANLTRCSD